MGLSFGNAPTIGDTVRLPNGRQGTVKDASINLIRARLFNQVYYKVQWNDGDRRTRWYPFVDLVVEGRAGGEWVT